MTCLYKYTNLSIGSTRQIGKLNPEKIAIMAPVIYKKVTSISFLLVGVIFCFWGNYPNSKVSTL